jgi:2,3-dihydroxyphenylpropionate 1,2-dioxygenase
MVRDRDRLQGTHFRDGLARARECVEAFAPDLVVLFGGDHRRAFRHVVPAVGLVCSGGVIAEGGHAAEALDVPGDTARTLAEHLLGAGVDVTVCRDIELDHAFAQPMRDLLGAVPARPVLPVPINCATAPLPTPSRILAVGDAVATFLDDRAERVLVIGTGGLSHSPPSLEVDAYQLDDHERARINREGAAAAAGKIRSEWDEEFLTALTDFDRPTLTTLAATATERAGVGAQEVRTWLAAGAAGGSAPLHRVAYQPVPEWITGMAVVASR